MIPRCVRFGDDIASVRDLTVCVRLGVSDWNETAMRCTVKFLEDVLFLGATGPEFKTQHVWSSGGVKTRRTYASCEIRG
jgi:hypothetical protein